MSDTEATIAAIHRAFDGNGYPGDAYLQGSREGSEPLEQVGPFTGRREWAAIEAPFLDAHAGALNFFSEAGLRFFLPAFLVADVRRELKRADPVFLLTHGFSDVTVDVPAGTRTFRRVIGKSRLMNPLRYGAMTFADHARFRLSVFTREEANAIVAYLWFRKEVSDVDRSAIEAALDAYWLDRAKSAPAAGDLTRYLTEEDEFLHALGSAGL